MKFHLRKLFCQIKQDIELMEIQKYANQWEEIYDILLEFIEYENEDEEKDTMTFQNILENRDEIHELLILINKISKHHHRHPSFFRKIESVLLYLEENIKQSFTNSQIFNTFRYNKRILLFLFNQKIINIDQDIINFILYQKDTIFRSYKYYFYNEIKDKISSVERQAIEKELLKIDPNIFDNFQEKCQIGENSSYICSLIRNDLIEDFVAYVSRSNTSLSSFVDKSIFETNPLLLQKSATFIEYSAFYGSIQVFNFLRMNDVNLTPSLWKYSIHGRNPEIIHLIEENKIKPENHEFIDVLAESIKCHHNEFADYIENNYIDYNSSGENLLKLSHGKKILNFFKSEFGSQIIENENDNLLKEKVYKTAFKYHNYKYMLDDFNNDFHLKYLCEYNYIGFCKLYFKTIDRNTKFVIDVTNIDYFFYEISKYLFNDIINIVFFL